MSVTQKPHTGYEPGGHRILVFEKHVRLRITFEAGYPRLDCPYRVDAAILKQCELIRIGSRNHHDVAAGLGDVESLRFQPCPTRNVLSVAELRGGDLFSAKIGRPLDRRISLH